MFMIDMQGTFDFATASSSSRTPGERYWGSCMASETRSNARGSTSVPTAETLPGSAFEFTSTSPSRPFTGMRTMAPFSLMSFASAGRHTSVVSWPARASFTPSSEPYDAPRTRILRWAMGMLLQSVLVPPLSRARQAALAPRQDKSLLLPAQGHHQHVAPGRARGVQGPHGCHAMLHPRVVHQCRIQGRLEREASQQPAVGRVHGGR